MVGYHSGVEGDCRCGGEEGYRIDEVVGCHSDEEEASLCSEEGEPHFVLEEDCREVAPFAEEVGFHEASLSVVLVDCHEAARTGGEAGRCAAALTGAVGG